MSTDATIDTDNVSCLEDLFSDRTLMIHRNPRDFYVGDEEPTNVHETIKRVERQAAEVAQQLLDEYKIRKAVELLNELRGTSEYIE